MRSGGIEDPDVDAGQDGPHDRQVTATLHAGPDQGSSRRASGHDRREAAKRHPGHRGGAHRGDRAAVHDGDRQSGRAVVEDHDRVDRRDPERLVGIEPRDPFHADQIVCPVRVPAAQHRRHRVRERFGRSRVETDLGRQLRVGDESGHGPLRQVQPFEQGRHGGEDVHPGEVAQDRQIRHVNESSPPDVLACAHVHARSRGSTASRGPRAHHLVERTRRSVRRARARVRQGHRGRDRLDPVRPAGERWRRPAGPRRPPRVAGGTSHDAVVGQSGVTCLEAHLTAGSLGAHRPSDRGAW